MESIGLAPDRHCRDLRDSHFRGVLARDLRDRGMNEAAGAADAMCGWPEE